MFSFICVVRVHTQFLEMSVVLLLFQCLSLGNLVNDMLSHLLDCLISNYEVLQLCDIF